jgi:hypothetical protein
MTSLCISLEPRASIAVKRSTHIVTHRPMSQLQPLSDRCSPGFIQSSEQNPRSKMQPIPLLIGKRERVPAAATGAEVTAKCSGRINENR